MASGLEQRCNLLRPDWMLGDYGGPRGIRRTASAIGHRNAAHADSGGELRLMSQRLGEDATSRWMGSWNGTHSIRYIICGCSLPGYHGLLGLRSSNADGGVRFDAGLRSERDCSIEYLDA